MLRDVPYRLLGCFRGSELHGGFALSLVGHRAAGMLHPSFTPYLGIVYGQPRAKYVTEISRHKDIGNAFATFIKNEFDFLKLTFSPEVVDLQPFIWQGFDVELHYTYRLSLDNLEVVLDNMDPARRRNLSAPKTRSTSRSRR